MIFWIKWHLTFWPFWGFPLTFVWCWPPPTCCWTRSGTWSSGSGKEGSAGSSTSARARRMTEGTVGFALSTKEIPFRLLIGAGSLENRCLSHGASFGGLSESASSCPQLFTLSAQIRAWKAGRRECLAASGRFSAILVRTQSSWPQRRGAAYPMSCGRLSDKFWLQTKLSWPFS